ncbi:MAG: hypothetical protein ACTSW1_08470 [Candidatus Hodarchaeales archaeon]
MCEDNMKETVNIPITFYRPKGGPSDLNGDGDMLLMTILKKELPKYLDNHNKAVKVFITVCGDYRQHKTGGCMIPWS